MRFDRPISLGTPGNAGAGIPATPSTFNAADINVVFRGPNTSLGTAGTTISLAGAPELLEWSPAGTTQDNNPDFVPNTVFFVRFATPQSAVGTYSYSVGSNVQDRLQNPGAGGPNLPASDVTLVPASAPFDAPFVNTNLSASLPPPKFSKLLNENVPFVFTIVPSFGDLMFQVFGRSKPVSVSATDPPTNPNDPPMNFSILLTPPRFVAAPVARLTLTDVL